MKKVLSLLITCLLLFVAAGCTQPVAPAPAAPAAEGEAAAEEAAAEEAPASTAPEGATTIVMWHSMSGTLGETLTKLADMYNASRTDYQIELQFQGPYGDALTKFKATAPADLPDLFMVEAETSAYMLNSGLIKPIQEYIDRDNFDISVLEPDIRNYYTVNGELMNLGFGRTIVGFIYNVDMLEAAGYTDPAAQLKTWDDVLAASAKIVEEGIAPYGAALTPGGWGFEFYSAMAGEQIVDQNNGRSGNATRSIIDETGHGVRWFTFLRNWQNSPGILTEYTRAQDYYAAMGNQELAMFQTTSSNISTVFAAADGKFKVGFFPMPAPSEDSDGGLTVGGNSTWMIDSGDEVRMEGAWDWIKFSMEKDSVLTWAVGTGYAPITTEVVESDEYREAMEGIAPTIFTGIEALRAAGPENVGAFMPIFAQHRSIMWEQIQKLYADPNYTPEQATADFVERINEEFELYNLTN